MSASELISNLQAAIQSQEVAEQAFEDWQFEYDRNEAALALAMERRPILLAEKAKREHDLSEGRKDVAKANEAWWQFSRVAVKPEEAAPLPASPPQSAAPKSALGAPKKAPKVLTLEERQAMSEEQQNAFLGGRMSKEQVAALSKEEKRRRQALKSAAHDERKEHRTAEEQAKIDARVAAMSAGRAKKASPARALDAELEAASGAGGESE